MANAKSLSDFILTGCAIVPVMAVAAGLPEVALLSHIVLLFAGILIAGAEDEAPFKQPQDYPCETARARGKSNSGQNRGLLPKDEQAAAHLQRHTIINRRPLTVGSEPIKREID